MLALDGHRLRLDLRITFTKPRSQMAGALILKAAPVPSGLSRRTATSGHEKVPVTTVKIEPEQSVRAEWEQLSFGRAR
jgi:hypothetical protein